jgi:hypothetical protein
MDCSLGRTAAAGGGGGGGEEGEEEECNPNATTFGGKSLQNFDTRF